MVDNGPSFVPLVYSSQEARIVPARISAIHLVIGGDEPGRLGTITQLPQSAHLEVCGDGFNERTVKVRWQGSFYFVFREDVEIGAAHN
jgi:hypothetical protein